MKGLVTTIPNFCAKDGVALCPAVLLPPDLTNWKAKIDTQYEKLEWARRKGPDAVTQVIAPGQRFVLTASSLSLGAAFSHQDLHAILAAILAGPARSWINNELGNQIACDLDQAWIRRQYAPRNYPPLHSPHGWHQDGALGFDFLSYPNGNFPLDALLPMVTCWIALDPCGTDAPGLEFLMRRLDGLLAPAELLDERVRGRFTRDEFWRPVLEPGDALLFRGDILHRTYVTPEMTGHRSSIELRFAPAQNSASKLKGERFVRLDLTGGC